MPQLPDPHSRQGRLLGFGLLLCLLGLLLGGYGAHVATQIGDAQAGLAESQGLTARYRQLSQQAATLEQRLDEMESDRGWRASFLDSATPALAGAQLQRLAGDAAAEGAFEVSHAEVITALPDQPDAVGLRVHGKGDYEAVMAMLAALEAGNPRLSVNMLQIAPDQSHGRDRPGQPPQYALRLTLIGLMPPEGALP
ncbi:MAG: hypothetical protein Tsb0016_10250 [Sphingomonadales bacterium]